MDRDLPAYIALTAFGASSNFGSLIPILKSIAQRTSQIY